MGSLESLPRLPGVVGIRRGGDGGLKLGPGNRGPVQGGVLHSEGEIGAGACFGGNRAQGRQEFLGFMAGLLGLGNPEMGTGELDPRVNALPTIGGTGMSHGLEMRDAFEGVLLGEQKIAEFQLGAGIVGVQRDEKRALSRAASLESSSGDQRARSAIRPRTSSGVSGF